MIRLTHPFPGMSRDEAQRYYFNEFLPPGRVLPDWSGDVAAGDAGALGPQYAQAIIDRINNYRVLAGLEGVRLDPALSVPAQHAALIMAANGRLDHYPDPSWIHYSPLGAEGAARSNLHLIPGTRAIDGYVDEGPPANAPLGHRRWVLYPPQRTVGIGDIPGAAGGPMANALNVVGDRSGPRGTVVSWPPPGFVPVQIMPQAWSFSLQGADYSMASVSVSRDGEAVPVEVITRSGSYGDPTIGWMIDGNTTTWGTSEPVAVTRYDVTVAGVVVSEPGVEAPQIRSYSYTTYSFHPFDSFRQDGPEAPAGDAQIAFVPGSAYVPIPEHFSVELVRRGDLSMQAFVSLAEKLDEDGGLSLSAFARFAPGQDRIRVTWPFRTADDDGQPRRITLELFGQEGVQDAMEVLLPGYDSTTLPSLPPREGPQAPVDLDGDGRSDFLTYRTDGGFGWFEVVRSSDGRTRTVPLGKQGDLPIVADYDGDGVPDLAVYRADPATGTGHFLIERSTGGPIQVVPFGGAGDIPVAGDFDGDGVTDIAVYGFSPNDGYSRFAVLPSAGGRAWARPFGGRDDRPILGDFDGDGIADVAVYGYSPDDGFSRFGILYSSGRPTAMVPFGGRDDRPISGDFEGDGITDLAVYGYSPDNGFSRFGVVPSDASPAMTVAAGDRDSIGLPAFSGLFAEARAGQAALTASNASTAARRIASGPALDLLALASLAEADRSRTAGPIENNRAGSRATARSATGRPSAIPDARGAD